MRGENSSVGRRAGGEREETRRAEGLTSRAVPEYRPVLSRLEQLGVAVDLSIKDQEPNLLRHRNLQKLGRRRLRKGRSSSPTPGRSNRRTEAGHKLSASADQHETASAPPDRSLTGRLCETLMRPPVAASQRPDRLVFEPISSGTANVPKHVTVTCFDFPFSALSTGGA